MAGIQTIPLPSRTLPKILKSEVVAKTQNFEIERISLKFSNGVERVFERFKQWPPGVVMIIPMKDKQANFDNFIQCTLPSDLKN